jgi:hypothetical protein
MSKRVIDEQKSGLVRLQLLASGQSRSESSHVYGVRILSFDKPIALQGVACGGWKIGSPVLCYPKDGLAYILNLEYLSI